MDQIRIYFDFFQKYNISISQSLGYQLFNIASGLYQRGIQIQPCATSEIHFALFIKEANKTLKSVYEHFFALWPKINVQFVKMNFGCHIDATQW